jgi:tetratricopeptide (TPR) repeat protein
LAQEKYQQAIRYNPENRGAILEYSDFAAYTLRDYQESIDTLNILLNKNKNDFDPVLAYGDVHMEWARYTQEPALQTSLYDEARFAYVRLTNMYGQTDELLYRLMLYFVRTDNLPGAFELHKIFELDPRATVEPKIFAELGGFYIDRHLSGERNPFDSGDITTEERLLLTLPDLLEEAQRVLQAAIEQNPRLPEAHYNLARVFAEQGRYDQELRALRSAEILYRELRENRPPSQFEAAQEIDTYTRLGESYRRTRNNLSAEEAYRRAASLYEQARDNNWVSPHHDYGRIYANLADLYYYEGNDYSAALEFYQQAKANGYGQANRPEMSLLLRSLNYKIGFIHYVQEDFDQAIEAFNEAEGPSLTRNNNLMYAKANSLYQQGNYPPAAALYQILASRLVQERERISAFLVEEDSSHRGLIDFTIRVYNNLGATLHQLSIMAGPDRTRRQVEAQYYFSKATELSENLNRDLETAVRADTRSVAYLNLRSVLVPGFEDQVLLDPDLRKDLQSDVF